MFALINEPPLKQERVRYLLPKALLKDFEKLSWGFRVAVVG
jgi:hypothetical protein